MFTKNKIITEFKNLEKKITEIKGIMENNKKNINYYLKGFIYYKNTFEKLIIYVNEVQNFKNNPTGGKKSSKKRTTKKRTTKKRTTKKRTTKKRTTKKRTTKKRTTKRRV